MILNGNGSLSDIVSAIIHVKKSMMGPPQSMQITVPILIYLRAVSNKMTMMHTFTRICVFPCDQPIWRDIP